MGHTWLVQPFDDGEMLFEQGQVADGAYVLRKGKVRIFRDSGEHEITLGYVERGSMFGEMGLIESKGRSASAQAVGPVEVEYIDREGLRSRVPDQLVWTLLEDFARRLREMDDLFEQLECDKRSRQDIAASWSTRRSWVI